MTDLSPRKTAARAAAVALDWTWDASLDDDPLVPEPHEAIMPAVDAVLAAVADHDGLADVLRGHEFLPISNTCRCSKERSEDHADHLADVVRAWMVQT